MAVGKLIGIGATAEVFELDGGRVLKLFRTRMPDEVAKREYDNAVVVDGCGVPSPKALGCIERDGRIGIVYERVRGESMLKHMLFPWNTERDAERLAVLQYEIHQKKPKGLQQFKQMLAWNIQHAAPLTDLEKRTVLGILEELPDGCSLCHADFHPDNVLLRRRGPLILDWMTACVGDPAADVARTSVILSTAGELPGGIPKPVKNYVLRGKKSIGTAYLRKYMALSGMTRDRIDAWRVPVMAARLVEGRPEGEVGLLLCKIRALIGV